MGDLQPRPVRGILGTRYGHSSHIVLLSVSITRPSLQTERWWVGKMDTHLQLLI
jgi:hypothetical protein